MLTTLMSPAPTSISFGRILLSSVAPSRPVTPSMRGTLKPQMSASSTPTVNPCHASAAARFTVTLLLPTPPLPLATAMTRVVRGTSVRGALSAARWRARCMTPVRCSWFISPNCTSTSGANRSCRRRS